MHVLLFEDDVQGPSNIDSQSPVRETNSRYVLIKAPIDVTIN
jgi:hypothetical protein